ncbi:MAK10-like protein [Tanacetum coccineum]
MSAFISISLCDQASNWLERLPARSISTWEDLTTRFLAQLFPPGRTVKLRNDILIPMLVEVHLAPKQPVQVNKITSSCEICNGPYDTQYCMETPEQAFVDYASPRTDEVGGKCSLELVDLGKSSGEGSSLGKTTKAKEETDRFPPQHVITGREGERVAFKTFLNEYFFEIGTSSSVAVDLGTFLGDKSSSIISLISTT